MAKHKPPVTLSDFKAALGHDMKKQHAKELAIITKAKKIDALYSLMREFGSSKTMKLCDKLEAQEEA